MEDRIMKILVLGGTGMVGHVISLYFSEAGYDVTALTRKHIDYCKYIIGDATDSILLKKIIEQGNFDIIINSIGILNEDADDNKSMSILLNSFLPHFLSDCTIKMKTKIIHLSTDCVFSGKTGGYTEYSVKDGQSFYDRTKSLGEIDNKKDLTFRNSIIGPDMNYNGVGLFNWFMKQGTSINGYSNVFWTGVTTVTLVKAIEHVIKCNINGLYHLVNNSKISKENLLALFNKYFKNNSVIINSSSTPIIDKSLINTRKDFDFVVPSYENMIIEMREWIISHNNFYNHYKIMED
jgi:dTDP-4-dehydrorhamnose reductase